MQTNETPQYAIETKDLSIFYGAFKAVSDVNMLIERQKVTAIIGPSGCGKSTLLRSVNRMNDFVPSSYVTGEILMHGQNLYGSSIDPVEVRRSIGMVFQKPNPFPKSIYENIAWGARINGFKGNMDELVEQSLRGAALWGEVKDVLKKNYTIIIVTHNMQQAARVSDYTAMMMLEKDGSRSGTVIEFSETKKIFTNPKDKRTEDYVTGRFG